MVCFDTDIIVNFLRNEPKAVRIINKLIESEEQISTTTINSFELWKGAYRSKKENAKEVVETFLNNIGLLPLDKESSKKAGEIFELLASKGETVDALDVMISSIALSNNEEILTLNKKHFERIPNLKIFKLNLD